jgi:dienelactone hydrolase
VAPVGASEGGVNEHAGFVATSFGPIGVIVAGPSGEPRGAVVILKGAGPARFGRASMQARMARELAGRGLVVLRLDYPGQMDSSLASGRGRPPAPAVREVLEWFRAWNGGVDPFLIGMCYGGRVALSAATDGAAVAGVLAVLPHPGAVEGGAVRLALRRLFALRLGIQRPDRSLMRDVRRVAGRGIPTWFLTGEKDAQARYYASVARRLRVDAPAFELEAVPGIAMYGFATPEMRDLLVSRVTARLDAMIAEPARR